MTTIKEIMAKNRKALKAIINGDADSVTVAGVSVTRRIDSDRVKFVIRSSGLTVVADEMEISGSFADFMKNGTPVAFIALMED